MIGHVLIVGASRGLGREFVRQYLADGAQVVATARRPAEVAELEAAGMRRTLAAVKPAQNGSFLNHDGSPIGW